MAGNGARHVWNSVRLENLNADTTLRNARGAMFQVGPLEEPSRFFQTFTIFAGPGFVAGFGHRCNAALDVDDSSAAPVVFGGVENRSSEAGCQAAHSRRQRILFAIKHKYRCASPGIFRLEVP